MKVMERVRKVWRSLSIKERRIIRSKAKGAPSGLVRNHCKILVAIVQGIATTEIAKGSSSSVSQVYRVANRFVDEGPAGLVDHREDNGETKADESFAVQLIAIVQQQPRKFGYLRPTWTQELLALVLEKKTGTRVSRTTMSRLLKRLRIRWGMPKPTVGCPWNKWRKSRRLNTILRLIANLPKGHVVVYLDEVDIHLNPKIGRDYMLHGTQKRVVTPGKNQKRYLCGSLDAHTGELAWIESDRKNSALFCLFLWHLVDEVYPNAKCIHVILDNFKIHSSQATGLALRAIGSRIQLHFLPPYCPDHNRIERKWKDLHDNVTRNHQCRNMKELMKEVRHYLKQYNRKLQSKRAKTRAA